MRDCGSVFWWDFHKKKKKNSNCELLGIFFSGSFFFEFLFIYYFNYERRSVLWFWRVWNILVGVLEGLEFLCLKNFFAVAF